MLLFSIVCGQAHHCIPDVFTQASQQYAHAEMLCTKVSSITHYWQLRDIRLACHAGVLDGALPYGPAVADHCILTAGL